jgi:hypothetical protein
VTWLHKGKSGSYRNEGEGRRFGSEEGASGRVWACEANSIFGFENQSVWGRHVARKCSIPSHRAGPRVSSTLHHSTSTGILEFTEAHCDIVQRDFVHFSCDIKISPNA